MFLRVDTRHLNILVHTQHLNILTTCTLTLCVCTQYMYAQYLNVLAHTKPLNVLASRYPTPEYLSTHQTLQ